ncbi:MAG: hypothetical protein R2795_09080 [Saprospiraceae bacterium]
MKRILVLCTGNACRSRMAEAYLRHFGQGSMEVHSAGMRAIHTHPLAVKAMLDDNIDMTEVSPRDVAHFSGQEFDYLITVSPDALSKLPADIQVKEHIALDIPDPLHVLSHSSESEEQVFSHIREGIKKAMLRFVGQLSFNAVAC